MVIALVLCCSSTRNINTIKNHKNHNTLVEAKVQNVVDGDPLWDCDMFLQHMLRCAARVMTIETVR